MPQADTDDYRRLLLKDVPLIDTRAPVEFARGAFPQACNLPLMDDEQRHQVGLRYKQAGQDAAIALGKTLLTPTLRAARTQAWVEFSQTHPDGYLYCFRGGLRSRITQSWLRDAGVHYPRVVGGYKALRRFLIDAFSAAVERAPLVLLGGRTGSGKTQLLTSLPHHVDLEAIAGHRGSSFGHLDGEQPTPIQFENTLAIHWLRAMEDKPAPLMVEAEGRLIGSLCLPLPLWQKMQAAPCVLLETDLAQRVSIAIDDYVVDLTRRLQTFLPRDDAITHLGERHRHSLYRIRKRLGGVRYEQARKLLDAAVCAHRDHDALDGYRPFVALLLKDYYDPMYDYQLSQRSTRVLLRGDAETLRDWATTSSPISSLPSIA
ncbi:MAG TPA: tRNA 2-selenouridine(34) synthase MnmH [Gammaproteobacteria bacterium]|nr:tRNA 2-selenouridine(34) synthase MnmH [Gammaproteobacteria bacterium]